MSKESTEHIIFDTRAKVDALVELGRARDLRDAAERKEANKQRDILHQRIADSNKMMVEQFIPLTAGVTAALKDVSELHAQVITQMTAPEPARSITWRDAAVAFAFIAWGFFEVIQKAPAIS